MFVNICANFLLNPKKTAGNFWNIENQSFQERQFSCLSFLQYYLKMLSTSVKNKNECDIYKKKI